MTIAVGVIALTFDSQDLQSSDLGIFLEIIRGLNEPFGARGVDLVVPSHAGRIVRNRVADALTIELRGYVMGTDREDFRDNAGTVRALFDPSAEPADLVATLEDASTATIAARTLNSVWNQIAPEIAEVSIEMESVVPDWAIT